MVCYITYGMLCYITCYDMYISYMTYLMLCYTTYVIWHRLSYITYAMLLYVMLYNMLYNTRYVILSYLIQHVTCYVI